MKPRVLLCVLDWGLGHATRSLAVLKELELQGCEVLVASSGRALAHLSIELPGRRMYELPSYGVTYSGRSFAVGMLTQVRKILKAVVAEKHATAQIIQNEKIDIIISDNRYGCFNRAITNIFLSHQLTILANGFWKIIAPIVNYYHTRLIKQFDHVWIPDYPDRLLTGALSESGLSNLTFVGPLTVMRRTSSSQPPVREYIGVASGPEPARTRFSDMLYSQLKGQGKSFLLVDGKPGGTSQNANSRIQHCTQGEVCSAIQSSKALISRPGYSTIMDMAALGGMAIFVPTPGQTEQLYLARRMEKMGIAGYQEERYFDLAQSAKEMVRYSGFVGLTRDGNLLKEAIEKLIA